jgi:hypothetical protein
MKELMGFDTVCPATPPSLSITEFHINLRIAGICEERWAYIGRYTKFFCPILVIAGALLGA